MRVILSRKGFDSENGGKPSPILPDGRLISLPIPSQGEKLGYRDLQLTSGKTYRDMMYELGCQDHDGTCHVDPDICTDVVPRPKGWKPVFGQIHAAQTHLDNWGVGVGDLFLFLGWFRHTRQDRFGKLMFDPADREGKHVVFGYLQVGDKMRLTVLTRCPAWMVHHPHTELKRRQRSNNTVYIARDTLSWDNDRSGAGVFCFDQSLVLTKAGMSRSCWQLPAFFKSLSITYHSASSWKNGYFQSASRGQEFVIQESPQAENWAKGLIQKNLVWQGLSNG